MVVARMANAHDLHIFIYFLLYVPALRKICMDRYLVIVHFNIMMFCKLKCKL